MEKTRDIIIMEHRLAFAKEGLHRRGLNDTVKNWWVNGSVIFIVNADGTCIQETMLVY